MASKTAALRRLLAEEAFIHMPVAYDALGGRLIEQTGFKAAYVGGFVTGLSLVIVLRPGGVPLLQPPRSQVFATTRPRAFTYPKRFSGGSVPPAGRRFTRSRSPWD